jgi:adenine-specific DNA-methyltransferase
VNGYRHSKWLAMMERRLLIAKELLNPADSVLIVTIDEKEYLRLGLLLEQTFAAAAIQMISVSINPAAVARKGFFGRSDEYYFFLRLGVAGASPLLLRSDWVTTKGRTHQGNIRWDLLRRSGSSPLRQGHPGTFYPVYIHADGSAIHSIGRPLESPSVNRASVVPPEGMVAVWPIRKNGTEGRWSIGPDAVEDLRRQGYLRLGEYKGEQTPIYYLAKGEVEKIEAGQYQVTGRESDGSVRTTELEGDERPVVPGSQWRIPAHDSTQYGSRLLAKIIPDRIFPYPKSLYAVEDALRFFVSGKPRATVLDFFSGSGTTAHAVMRLNHQDGGRRQCISVTNNEVAADEQRFLLEQRLRPGDAEWEKHGICDYITKPRVAAAITGTTPNGEPIEGAYKFTDEFPMAVGFEENAEFFTLSYEAKNAVDHNLAFARIASLLWLRAGARGRRIDELPADGWAVADTYGLLTELDRATPFIEAVSNASGLLVAYVVTDDDRRFQAIAKRLREGVEPVRLYESYLSNFSFANGD